MKLMCTVDLTLASALFDTASSAANDRSPEMSDAATAVSLAVRYHPAADNRSTVWSPLASPTSAAPSASVSLYRLRPSTAYVAHVCVVVSSGDDDDGAVVQTIAELRFESAATGFADLDADGGALATLAPGAAFRFDVIMLDFKSDSSGFAGIIALDNEGHVVWCVAEHRSSEPCAARHTR